MPRTTFSWFIEFPSSTLKISVFTTPLSSNLFSQFLLPTDILLSYLMEKIKEIRGELPNFPHMHTTTTTYQKVSTSSTSPSVAEDVLFTFTLRATLHLCFSSWPRSSLTPRTVAYQAPLSVEFSRQEPTRSLGYLPDPGIELVSLASPALSGRFFTTRTRNRKIRLILNFFFCFIVWRKIKND